MRYEILPFNPLSRYNIANQNSTTVCTLLVKPSPTKYNSSTSEKSKPQPRLAKTSENMNMNPRSSAMHTSDTGRTSISTPTYPIARRGGHFGGNRGAFHATFVPYHTHPANHHENSLSNGFRRSSHRSVSQNSNGVSIPRLLSRPVGPGLLKPRQEWMEWQEVSIRVRRLPPDIETWDLWQAFEKEGTVTFIELDSGRDGQRDGTAKVRFMPPPARDFWTVVKYPVLLAESGTTIFCEVSLILKKKERTWKIQSPVRKHIYYPELIKVYPLALDFGFMYDPDTMMHMRSAPSREQKDLIFQVDLLRKKLVIFFPYQFTDPKNRKNPAASIGDLARNSQYMIWIPFEQIEKIYRVDLNDNTTSFIISLDCPPCFFRKRQDMRASHAKEANVWSEMDTWYRQTDIIYDPSTIKQKPVSLRKGEVEIDIGKKKSYLGYGIH